MRKRNRAAVGGLTVDAKGAQQWRKTEAQKRAPTAPLRSFLLSISRTAGRCLALRFPCPLPRPQRTSTAVTPHARPPPSTDASAGPRRCGGHRRRRRRGSVVAAATAAAQRAAAKKDCRQKPTLKNSAGPPRASQAGRAERGGEGGGTIMTALSPLPHGHPQVMPRRRRRRHGSSGWRSTPPAVVPPQPPPSLPATDAFPRRRRHRYPSLTPPPATLATRTFPTTNPPPHPTGQTALQPSPPPLPQCPSTAARMSALATIRISRVGVAADASRTSPEKQAN